MKKFAIFDLFRSCFFKAIADFTRHAARPTVVGNLSLRDLTFSALAFSKQSLISRAMRRAPRSWGTPSLRDLTFYALAFSKQSLIFTRHAARPTVVGNLSLRDLTFSALAFSKQSLIFTRHAARPTVVGNPGIIPRGIIVLMVLFFAFGFIIKDANAVRSYEDYLNLQKKDDDKFDIKKFNQDFTNYKQKISFYSKEKKFRAAFSVAIANNDEKRAYGLMNLRNLPKKYGMIFYFDKSDVVAMWMKNTLIPLDMIFIESGKVVAIHKNAKPYDLSVISSGVVVDQVLEINAGEVDEFGIEIGDFLLMPVY